MNKVQLNRVALSVVLLSVACLANGCILLMYAVYDDGYDKLATIAITDQPERLMVTRRLRDCDQLIFSLPKGDDRYEDGTIKWSPNRDTPVEINITNCGRSRIELTASYDEEIDSKGRILRMNQMDRLIELGPGESASLVAGPLSQLLSTRLKPKQHSSPQHYRIEIAYSQKKNPAGKPIRVKLGLQKPGQEWS